MRLMETQQRPAGGRLLVAEGARPSADLDAWILQNLDDEAARKARVDTLVAQARRFSYTHSEVLQTLGNLYAHNVA